MASSFQRTVKPALALHRIRVSHALRPGQSIPTGHGSHMRHGFCSSKVCTGCLDMSKSMESLRASTDRGLPLFPITYITGNGLEPGHATAGIRPSVVWRSETDGSFEAPLFYATRYSLRRTDSGT